MLRQVRNWSQHGNGLTSRLTRSITSFRQMQEKSIHEEQAAFEHLYSTRETLPLICQKLLNEGVLDRVDYHAKTDAGRAILANYLAQCRNVEERQEMVVGFTLLLTRYRMAISHCEKCLYPRVRCACKHIRKVRPKNKLWLFQHVGEYGRNNNTGGLLCLVADARRTTRGILEEQDQLVEYLLQHPFSSAIVFPSKDAMTVEEFDMERAVEMGSEENSSTLVLLDGTSRQAKNFDRFLPKDIPRVRVNDDRDESWLDPIRRQTEEHRVCTAQAAAMVLSKLGDIETSNAIEEAVQGVINIAQLRRYDAGKEKRKPKRHARPTELQPTRRRANMTNRQGHGC